MKGNRSNLKTNITDPENLNQMQRFLDLQEKSLANERLQLELHQKDSTENRKVSLESYKIWLSHREKIENVESKKLIIVLVFLGILCVIMMTIGGLAILKGHETAGVAILTLVAGVLTGGAGGYGIGKISTNKVQEFKEDTE